MNLKFSRYDVSKLVFALSDASKNVKRAKKTHVNFSNKLDSPKVMKALRKMAKEEGNGRPNN